MPPERPPIPPLRFYFGPGSQDEMQWNLGYSLYRKGQHVEEVQNQAPATIEAASSPMTEICMD